MDIIKFYNTEAEFQNFKLTLKLRDCPNCKCTGTLNMHGYLYGHDERGCCTRLVRGRRLFCNNRHHRPGCGKTFSVLISGFIKGFIITTRTLWLFLCAVVFHGTEKKDALTQLEADFHYSCAYRLYTRVFRRQPILRTTMSRYGPVEDSLKNDNPLSIILTIMRDKFKCFTSPISEYQSSLQKHFL